jgi:hypothetical protein
VSDAPVAPAIASADATLETRVLELEQLVEQLGTRVKLLEEIVETLLPDADQVAGADLQPSDPLGHHAFVGRVRSRAR